MSEDTGGLVLTPPARNFSPVVPVDDPPGRHDPRGPAARARPRGHSGLAGAPPGPPDRAARARTCTCSRSTSRRSNRRPARATGGTRSSSTPRTPCRSRPTCSCPTTAGTSLPGRRCWPPTVTVRASPRSSGSSTPTCPTPTTDSSWSAAATWCWRPTSAASASGWTGIPRTTTPATPIWCTPPWPVGTPWRRTSGTCGARSMCWSSTRWSTRHAWVWSASPTAAP